MQSLLQGPPQALASTASSAAASESVQRVHGKKQAATVHTVSAVRNEALAAAPAAETVPTLADAAAQGFSQPPASKPNTMQFSKQPLLQLKTTPEHACWGGDAPPGQSFQTSSEAATQRLIARQVTQPQAPP